MEKVVIEKGEILSDSDKQRWIIGSFLGHDEITRYEAALCDDKPPTDYPAMLQIVPCANEPIGFQFYSKYAKPNELDKWKRRRGGIHLGIPVLLGEGSHTINDKNYKFIVIQRHGKNLWSLFLENGKKFPVYTAYNIMLQLLNILKYIHSKSYFLNYISALNIVVDMETENHIYFIDKYVAPQYIENNIEVVLWSRDSHKRDQTERGDLEVLFYNLVQWLGIELPWEKNFEDPSLVLKEKENAFADVKAFLKSRKIEIPNPVKEFMKLVGKMNSSSKPKYSDFTGILVEGLKELHHEPSSKLEFSISSASIAERMAGDCNQVNKADKKCKKLPTLPKLGHSVLTKAKIISENCRHEGEVKLRENGPGSLLEILPQENSESLDLPITSPPHATQILEDARSPSPCPRNEVQSYPVRPSTSRRSPTTGDSPSEAMTSSRTFVMEDCGFSEVGVVEVKRETDRIDEEVTECRSSESARCESWQDKYDKLNAWLKLKEQNLDAFGSIPSEPQMIVDQVQQVWVLLDESHRSLLLRRLKNTELPPDSDDVQGLEALLEQVEHRWWDLQARLEKRGKELGDACRQKLHDALQDVSNDLNQLSLDNDSDEQRLSKIETLAGQLEGLRRTLLANATAVAEQLCQALRNQAYTSDLRVQLRSVKTLYSNLQKKIAIKKVEVESSLKDSRQFDDSCKEMNVWLIKELENVLQKTPVSTDHTVLQQQHDYYKVEHQRIMDNETHVMRLLKMGRNRLRPQNSTQQRFIESIESQWNCLIKQSFDIFNKLKTCVEICDKFYHTQGLFLHWLSKAERTLESIKPVSLDDIEKQLKQLSAFRHEVDEKLIQFEQYIDLSHKFISICDVDEDDVMKNEISSTKAKWTKLNRDMLNRLQSLKDVNGRYDDFKRSLNNLQKRVELYENKLTSHDALEVRKLQMEMTSLQKSRDAMRQQADDLVLKAREQGINVSHLLGVVNRLTNHIQHLKVKLDETRVLEEEYNKFEKVIQGNKSVESRDSSITHSDRSQDRDSEPNGPRCDKKKRDSLSRKRSRSKESVSSSSRSIKSRDSSMSHQNDKNDDSRPNSGINPFRLKKFKNCKNEYQNYRLPRRDESMQQTPNFRNNKTYYDFDRSSTRGLSEKRHWRKQHFERKRKSWQSYRSNTSRNFEGKDGAQRGSYYDSRFGRRSRSPRRNQRWDFQQKHPFRNITRENSAY